MSAEQKINELIDRYQVPSIKQKDAVWHHLEGQLGSVQEVKKVPFYRNRGLNMAASLLLLALICTFLTDYFHNREKYRSLPGNRITVWLPDSSSVQLNPNSLLKINYSFISGKRTAVLNGEAFFSIRPGKSFSVAFPGGKVKVLGTEFLIKAYENKVVQVNCLSGKVKFEAGEKKEIIGAGQGVEKKNNVFSEITVERSRAVAQFNGNFSWKNKPVGEIFTILENRFAIEVIASDRLVTRQFTGDLVMNDLETTCEVLAFAMNVKYHLDKKRNIVVFED